MSYRYPPSPLAYASSRRQSGISAIDALGDGDDLDTPRRLDVGIDAVSEFSDKPAKGGLAGRSVLYGLVNAVLNIPALIGYASIIFSDPFFKPYIPQLVKLVLWSSFVHQVIFTLNSHLPFAIGQVQDAGLIFLSAMATSVVQIVLNGKDQDYTPEQATTALSTACCTLMMATALLGLALMATGTLRGAAFVQYLPMPVVSGYLAFIGLFCVEAGLALSTGKNINTDPTSWPLLWSSSGTLLLAFPAVLAGVFLLFVAEKFDSNKHPGALPIAFVSLPLLFYGVLLCSGRDVEWAQKNGWLTEPAPGESPGFLAAFGVFDFAMVDWSAALRQLPTWLGMYFVVAFSSCLDVAAIEMDLGEQLDVNHELGRVVGVSNLVSGLTGGFTGSYIISLTVFTMRTAPGSRIVGWVCALSSLLMCFLPFSATDYVPLFMFAGALIFIGLDLIKLWLWGSLVRLAWQESLLVLGSFVCINVWGLEGGLVLGIALSAIAFIVEFAVSPSVERVRRVSMIHRHPDQRQYLRRHHNSIVQLRLEGHLFFGSALSVLHAVKQNIQVPAEVMSPLAPDRGECESPRETTKLIQEEDAGPRVPLARLTSVRRVVTYEHPTPKMVPLQAPPGQRNVKRTRFVLLDFSGVHGVDTTAVRTCFLSLRQTLDKHGVVTVFAGMEPTVQAQFQRCDLLDDTDMCVVFSEAEAALEWCENQLLEDGAKRIPSLIDKAGLMLLKEAPREGLVNVFAQLAQPSSGLSRTEADQELFAELADAWETSPHSANTDIFSPGDDGGSLYLLVRGSVEILLPEEGQQGTLRKTVQRIAPGNLFGDIDWHLRRPRTYFATSGSEGADVARLTEEGREALRPELKMLLMELLLSHMSWQLLIADGET